MSPNNPNFFPNTQPTIDYESGSVNRSAIAVGGLAFVVATAAIGAALVMPHKKAKAPELGQPVAGAANFNSNYCADLSFANAAANPVTYNADAAFPRPDKPIKSESDVQPYIASLFDKNGPLAGQGDASPIALAKAIIDIPARDKQVFDPNRSVIADYDKTIAAYSVPKTGIKVAAADCVLLADTLRQTASYSVRFAAAGAKLVKYRIDRGTNYKVTGVTTTNVGAKDDLSGIKFTLPETAKGLDDFGAVYLATTPGHEGEIYVLGSVVAPQSSKNSLNQNGQKLTPAEKSKVFATIKAAAGGKTTSNTGGVTGGTNGNTGKTGTSVGTVPENKQGPAGGTASGSGATPEASSGVTHNTPGGGGKASPTPTPGNTPPPVVVVVPSKSPTPKPTDTFIPPPPTVPPTPSPTPKGTEQPCVSNPPYLIC